jgi:hypothetical protein
VQGDNRMSVAIFNKSSKTGQGAAALVGNAGAGCPTCALGIQLDENVYFSMLSVPPGAPLNFQLPKVVTAAVARRQLLFIVGEDVASGWWDCMSGEFLGDNARAEARIVQRIKQAGLESVAPMLTPRGMGKPIKGRFWPHGWS